MQPSMPAHHAIESRLQPAGRVKVAADPVVERFADRLNAAGRLSPAPAAASAALQRWVLDELKTVARMIDASRETGTAPGYQRRLLYEVPGRWSLALIILRPGQHTEIHNHDGWGAAVTVQGVERNQLFVHDASGEWVPYSQVDYPSGTGYVFDADQVHCPMGADPRQVTVALHILVHEANGDV